MHNHGGDVGHGLAAACFSDANQVVARQDHGPGLHLDWRWLCKAFLFKDFNDGVGEGDLHKAQHGLWNFSAGLVGDVDGVLQPDLPALLQSPQGRAGVLHEELLLHRDNVHALPLDLVEFHVLEGRSVSLRAVPIIGWHDAGPRVRSLRLVVLPHVGHVVGADGPTVRRCHSCCCLHRQPTPHNPNRSRRTRHGTWGRARSGRRANPGRTHP
mmetsp:Transcript_46497/g.107308  ORF Transcript_46497/g.107308 Transcript_46497/m.107308 type:complete len:212 (-) Transcript_46497:4-639(-)